MGIILGDSTMSCIKKDYIEEMFQRHFKAMLRPQDDNEEPHPAVAHMDAVRIIETINVLQAMLHHQQQLLNLYYGTAHQDACYIPILEQKWSKPKTYGDIQGEAKVEKKRTLKIIRHMFVRKIGIYPNAPGICEC